MATADAKRPNKITQIVRLKQVVQRWKNMSLKRRSVETADFDSGSNRRTPSGSVAVYVGAERSRFVIPTRFLNLPIFISLLDKAEEEFGFQSNGGLVLPSEVGFFREMLKLLERDEQKFGGLGLDEFLKVLSDVGFDSCRDSTGSCQVFKPLLQKN